MKKFSLLIGSVCGIAFWSLVSIGNATKPVPHPTIQQMLGSWVGYYETDYPDFCRLTLGTERTGSLVIVNPTISPYVYSVAWELKQGTNDLLLLSMTSVGRAEGIDCSVEHFNGRKITLTLKGRTNDWQRTATLIAEKDLIRNIDKAKKFQPIHRN